ncbi:unnamed protein product, partial [Bubo scandiacus]
NMIFYCNRSWFGFTPQTLPHCRLLPVSPSLPLRGERRGQPVGPRGCPGPASEQLPHPHPHPRTLRALPPRPASPPRPGRW